MSCTLTRRARAFTTLAGLTVLARIVARAAVVDVCLPVNARQCGRVLVVAAQIVSCESDGVSAVMVGSMVSSHG